MSNYETNGNGQPIHKPGLYKHPESGAEIIVGATPKFGSPIADGVYQVGFRYVGPAPVQEETPVVSETEKSK